MNKISECCGAAATDPIMLDYGICPECNEHCEFVEEKEPDDYRIYNNFNHEGGIKYTHTIEKP